QPVPLEWHARRTCERRRASAGAGAMTMKTKRSPGWQRGAATIEFAVLMFPLATLTFGVTEAGRALHQYNTLAKSVRDAARYQSGVTPGNTLAAQCVALTGSAATSGPNCPGTPLLPAMT